MLEVDDTVPLLSASTITSNNRVWYRILYDGMMMHVTADDDSFEEINVPKPSSPNGIDVYVNTGDGTPLRIRSVPNTDNDTTIIGRLADGAAVLVTNETPQNSIWYAVYGQLNDGTYSYGWCSGEFLGNRVEYGTLVDVNSLTVRSSAGTDYTNLGTIYRGETVEVLEKNCAVNSGYTWHEILYNGSLGYVVAGNNTPNFTFYTQWVSLVSVQTTEVPVHVTEACINFIIDYETSDFWPTVRDDGFGNPSIGYGHLVQEGEEFGVITEEEARQLLVQDMEASERTVRNMSKNRNVIWNQQQFDALVSLAYNVGIEVAYAMDEIIAGADPYDVFPQFSHEDGEFVLGLYRRRMDEADIFVHGTYVREERNPPTE